MHEHKLRPLTSIVTRQKLRKFCREVLRHPSYAMDLASSDPYLFTYMANWTNSSQEKWSPFFANKSESCYKTGTMKLPRKGNKLSNKTVHI